jgi:hypothetical protein
MAPVDVTTLTAKRFWYIHLLSMGSSKVASAFVPIPKTSAPGQPT